MSRQLTDDEMRIISAALSEFMDCDRWDEFDYDTADHLDKMFDRHVRRTEES